VVSREPEFPRLLSIEEKAGILREIVDEFQSLLRGEGLDCRLEGDCLVVWTTERVGWRRRPVARRVQVLAMPVTEEPSGPIDVLLSLHRIPDPLRSALSCRRVTWLDLEAKERSDSGNDLGEEVVQHLRRHGVRLFRVKAT
jgi:hypothetical protein